MRSGPDFATVYSRVVSLALDGQHAEARSDLLSVPGWRAPMDPKRVGRSLPCSLQIRVFHRDSFTCRYCSRRTVFPPVLRLLALPFGDIFPYHPHWKMTETHLAFWRDSASCDHLVPVARCGASTAENLVTACYMCNSIKQNWLVEELGWGLRPIQDSDWDGPASLYPSLFVKVAGISPKARGRYFREWLRVLENSGQEA